MAAGARFHHHDPGTAEPTWLLSDAWDDLPVLDVDQVAHHYARVVVVCAHPDDETLGVGALVASLSDLGAEIVVVVATSGEASHPRSTTWSTGLLARTRRAEVEAALSVLAPAARVVHLGLPDGGLERREGELVDELVSIIDASTLVVAPWHEDGHCDHDALGRAAEHACRRRGADVVFYPLWVWHWSHPRDFPWDRAVVVEPSVAALERKRRAVDAFGSQIYPLGPLAGDEEVVTDAVVTRAARLVEVVLRSDVPADVPLMPGASDAVAATFDDMYDDTDDPWSSTSFYERRKHGLTVDLLGRERYGRALEIGCATGALTRLLAQRCGEVVGMDASAQALRRARAADRSGRSPGAPHGDAPAAGVIDWVHGQAPADIPDGPFDLVVVSEVGYFMSATQLYATLRRVRSVLAEGGEIVLAHWQHPTRHIPLDGRLVHAQAATFFDLPHRAHYVDADVVVDVWGSPFSIARQEGLR